MPSPFPGMDPYLEGELWSVLHTQLGAEVARDLTARLVPRYVALANRRFITDTPDNVAVLNEETVLPESVPHVWVEVRDTAKRSLVAAIEFLSPSNKRDEGRREYLEKRRRILLSPAHLLEVDLLRKGRRVPMQESLPPAPYFVLLSRARKRPLTDVWPVGLDHPLPTVPVPLLDGDADVLLDLQKAFTTAYDVCRCDLLVDYKRSPEVPLPPEAAPWAEARLRAAGLRP